LIGIDVDGTLVGASGSVHPGVWKAAQAAANCGIRLALCSGRPAFGTALEYARRLDADGWHIFQNGASVLHLAARESRSVSLPPSCIAQLIAHARESAQLLELYSDDDYVYESASPWARAHAELLGVTFAPRSFASLTRPVVRAQWLLSADQAVRCMSAPHPGLELSQSTSPLMPGTRFVGLTKEGVSKGSALRRVAGQYGIDLRDVMYVGDAGNDLSALRIVGHPVAMANADPAVLEAAGHTVGHVDDGGLAQALELAVATHRANGAADP
jgi:Cof subfamily protein (haloacid dehalogenase superfamily)